ncbi:MAG: prephenate dehydratase [Desulfosarcinaceae bacterium]|nr:prephenate dehydratase [Desulfosarcinaceae bacterium]
MTHKLNVAFQGIRGAYSELSLRCHFKEAVEPVSCDSFDAVFAAVAEERADYGYIPVENSIAGTVVENYDLLLASNTVVIGEAYMPIRHMLLGPPGARLDQVTEAHSHPQALSQCAAFLKKHNIRPMATYDTAGAAKMVAEWQDPAKAAIASELCADYYAVTILEKDIQTNSTNTTRFFVIVRSDHRPGSVTAEKTTVAFKTRHYPGALVDCLKIFQRHNLNLTKLESRPIPENPWEYVFYAAFEAGSDTPAALQALGELAAQALFVKVLGSYPKASQCW